MKSGGTRIADITVAQVVAGIAVLIAILVIMWGIGMGLIDLSTLAPE